LEITIEEKKGMSIVFEKSEFPVRKISGGKCLRKRGKRKVFEKSGMRKGDQKKGTGLFGNKSRDFSVWGGELVNFVLTVLPTGRGHAAELGGEGRKAKTVDHGRYLSLNQQAEKAESHTGEGRGRCSSMGGRIWVREFLLQNQKKRGLRRRIRSDPQKLTNPKTRRKQRS